MTQRHLPMSFLNALLDFIYPAVCTYCENSLQDNEKLFCTKCWQLAKPVENAMVEELTAVKVRGDSPITAIKCGWWFEDFMQAVIHELKYKRKLSLVKTMGQFLARLISEDTNFSDADYLIPVPLHKSKQRERGYNQSLLIANEIARGTNIKSGDKIIKRRSKTQTQAKLDAEERMLNVSKAFLVTRAEKLKGNKVILVDDVCTTGATLFACADAFLAAGCRQVYAVTVAKALDVE